MSTIPVLWHLDTTSTRLVCDHLRSSIVVIGDRVRPSNTGRGYVLRRLIRRVLTRLWRDDLSHTLYDLPVEPIRQTLQHFTQPTDPLRVRDVLLDEQRRFEGLLRRGRDVLFRRLSRGPLTERDYHELHDTHGLPRDLVRMLLP
jgi:alanyl-tRNA synthetase